MARRRVSYSFQGIGNFLTWAIILTLIVLFWKKIKAFFLTIKSLFSSIGNLGENVAEGFADATLASGKAAAFAIKGLVNPSQMAKDIVAKDVEKILSTESAFQPDYWISHTTKEEKEDLKKFDAPLKVAYTEIKKMYVNKKYYDTFINMQQVIARAKSKVQLSYFSYRFFKETGFPLAPMMRYFIEYDLKLSKKQYQQMLFGTFNWYQKQFPKN